MSGFEYEVEIDAPPDRVWEALRDRAEIKRWHGWHFDGLDEEIEVIYFTRFTEDGKRILRLGDGDTFTLSDVDGRTILRVTRAPKGNNPEWDAYYEDVNEGWTSFMQQLRFALERHPGQDRQTVFLSGEGNKPRAIFDLVDGLPAGTPYKATAPTGELLQGEIWFRSPNQVGLTVAGWGEGLLVAGKGMLILTTYGDKETIEKPWQSWWETSAA